MTQRARAIHLNLILSQLHLPIHGAANADGSNQPNILMIDDFVYGKAAMGNQLNAAQASFQTLIRFSQGPLEVGPLGRLRPRDADDNNDDDNEDDEDVNGDDKKKEDDRNGLPHRAWRQHWRCGGHTFSSRLEDFHCLQAQHLKYPQILTKIYLSNMQHIFCRYVSVKYFEHKHKTF